MLVSSLLALSRPMLANAQEGGVIKGQVHSEKGSPIAGVSVVLRSADGKVTKSAETDSLGNFSFPGLDAALTYILDFADVNYQNQTKPDLSANQTVDISLRAKEGDLDEVVVVGYGTQKKKELSSAIVSVKSEDFNAGGARNAMDLIQGKVAGLTITRTSSSNPNSSPSIQLRSVASINGSNSPLVVIDGIPGGNLDLLQQSDIESIDVIKDGSAAAIYGTRANGGVILVTTKKGSKDGKSTYDYAAWARKDFLYRYPKVMTAAQYREKIDEGVIDESNDEGASTDWFDLLINHHNFSQYHNMALSGGNAKNNYRASIYWSNYEGIAKENSRMQYGGHLTVNHTGFKDRLVTQVNLMMNYNRANLLGGSNWEDALFKDNPTQSPYDTSNIGGYWVDSQIENPVSLLAQQTSKRDQQTSIAQFASTLKIAQSLSAKISGSIQRNQYNDNQYKQLYSRASQLDTDYPDGGYAYKGSYLSSDYLLEPTIEYNSHFSEDHSISAVGGYSYQYHEDESYTASNKGFSNDEEAENDLNAGIALANGKASMSSSKYANKLIAFFGRLNYAYKGKYMATFILRHEGSTRFGTDNKWGNFPGASLAWTVSQESFMNNVSWVNFLKLRAGFGITGNQDFDNGVSQVTLGTGGYYLFPDGSWQQTYGPNKNANPDLRWEKKSEINIGTDFNLFNNRLTGSFDWFNRYTKDLAISATVSQPANVASTTYLNIGALGSTGVELALGYKAIDSKDFGWQINATASHATTKLKKYTAGNYLEEGSIGGYGDLGDAIRTYEGGKVGQFYGKRYAGLADDGTWLFYSKDGEKVTSSTVNSDDYTYIGNGVPKYYASLSNTFTYKAFSLRFSLRGKFGYDILNTMDISYGNKVSLPYNVLQRTFTDYNDLNDTYQYSDFYLQNGNFLKLDEVTFNYKVPVKTSYIRYLNVYVTASNIALITSYKGNDPDFVDDTGLAPGMDARGVYPSTRSFLLGVNIGF
ncbi:MAG: SusC/RagA family TonB-linked outer membrane protein [Chitinophagaceae bacterium]